MFRFRFPSQQIRSVADGARRQMVSDRTELLHELGAQLVRLARDSFLVRAGGGEDAGIVWEELTESRKKAKDRRGYDSGIGIATGGLLDSLEYDITGDEVSADFRAAHAFAFNELRQLMPDELPDEWRDELEELLAEWGQDILIEAVEDAGF